MTQEKANRQTQILICDRHESHISADFLAYYIHNNIILMLLPPHTSHLTQPLDVAVFNPLKKGNGRIP